MTMSTNAMLMGLAGGLAAALLFAAPLGGGTLGAPLFLAFPLAISIISFGWGSAAGAVSAAAGALFVALIISPLSGFIFAILGAAPIWLYCHMAGLARTDERGQTEWFPVSIVFTIVVALTPLTMLATGALLDVDVATLANELTDAVLKLSEGEIEQMPPRAVLLEALTFYIRLMPMILAFVWLPVMLGNIWIGARIARASGRLVRPMGLIADRIDLPRAAIGVLGLAIIVASFGEIWLVVAGYFVGSLLTAFALVGLAVIHVATRGKPWRGLALGAVYLLTFLFSLPVFPLALLGIIENFWGYRRRNSPSAPAA